MREHSRREIKNIEEKAKKEQNEAEKAKKELRDVLHHTHPQRESELKKKGIEKEEK